MTTSTPSVERTPAQEKKFRRLMEDIFQFVTDLALEKSKKVNKEKFQGVLEKGDQIKEVITQAALVKLGELTFSLLVSSGPSINTPATEGILLTKDVLEKEFNVKWMGSNFQKLFLGRNLKVGSEGKVAFWKLQKYSVDKPILEELGDQAKLDLGQMLWLVKRQRNGQSGPLLTNGYANIGYVEVEENGNTALWAVYFGWDASFGCWGVVALPVDDPNEWFADRQVLSQAIVETLC